MCAAPAAGAPAPGKKTPEVIAAIEAALQHDVAGDPITGIRWTRRTTEKIATELATLDIQVCPRTVARILKDLDYRLRVNHKRVSAGSGPDRDQQFQYIAEQHAQFAQRGLPIVSIDTKKRERPCRAAAARAHRRGCTAPGCARHAVDRRRAWVAAASGRRAPWSAADIATFTYLQGAARAAPLQPLAHLHHELRTAAAVAVGDHLGDDLQFRLAECAGMTKSR